MEDYHISKYGTFYVIGLSYQKADAEVRGRFSLDLQGKKAIVHAAKEKGIEGILVTSTCNRTEIYGFATDSQQLIDLLCQFTNGSMTEFEKVAYTYKNEAAIAHIFRVGTGLDSQILGDFEIIGQLKTGFALSKKAGMTNDFFEHLLNHVIQASKRIKTETQISSGATSVSFASVQYILQHTEAFSDKNILLFGTGKIGRNTCENLVKHTENPNITLINRTKEKAEQVAGRFNLTVKDYADLQAEIRKADVLVVATGAQNPTVSKELIYSDKALLILDLSIPKNVAEDVAELDNVTLVHLDELSRMTDETLEKRKTFIPQAERINAEVEVDFKVWLETRKFAPTIKALKDKLKLMNEEEIDFQRKKTKHFDQEQAEIFGDRMVQKIMNRFAGYLRHANGSTEASLELIHQIFELEKESK